MYTLATNNPGSHHQDFYLQYLQMFLKDTGTIYDIQMCICYEHFQ